MTHKATYFLAILFCILGGQNLRAQDADQDRKFEESIRKQVDQYEQTLKLEYWQVFYVDSILTHNFFALREESMALSKSGVANSDIYQAIADNWSEKTFVALQKVFTEEQWAKYLKTGAGKEKKARDKRAAAKKQ